MYSLGRDRLSHHRKILNLRLAPCLVEDGEAVVTPWDVEGRLAEV